MRNREAYYAPTVTREALSDGSPAYLAVCAAFPGVIAQGRTEEEARRQFEEMIKDAIAHFREHGLPLPPPNGLRVKIQAGSARKGQPTWGRKVVRNKSGGVGSMDSSR